jgi:hypothetical protein
VLTDRRAWFPLLVLALTVAQLAVAAFVPGIERFEDKAFGGRLVFYPLLMLLAPATWWVLVKRKHPDEPTPYFAFGLVMLPFLIDTTGNTLDLFDTWLWWDDANHFFNWMLLCWGLGLIVCGPVRPRWAVVPLVGGFGAVMAIVWELGEWFTFIRHGTEIETAYEDTLGDLALGTLGGLVAGGIVLWALSKHEAAEPERRVASHQ